MNIGEPFSWETTAFMENGWRDGNKNHKKDAVNGRVVYINEAPIDGGGGYQREEAQREL